jgi:thiamine biosynthesis lipoprotein
MGDKSMQRQEFRAMGCQMLAVLDSDAPWAAGRLADAPGWFAGWERQLSRFRDDSELVRLNQRAGALVQVSEVLWDVIQTALQAAQRSQGLVTPTMLAQLELAGYDRSFDRRRQIADGEPPIDDAAWRERSSFVPSPCPGPAIRPSSGDWSEIAWRPSDHAVRLPPGVRLDLGGIAKGWAADRAARQLGVYGPALVDAGGDIAVSGPMADGQPWPIEVADPADPIGQLELLMLPAGGVATSGRDYRRWRQGAAWQHHILDPRTGHPAETDVLSATVIAPSAREAETAAKVALIRGARDGLAWLEARPSLAGLLVLEDGRVARSRRLKDYVWN